MVSEEGDGVGQKISTSSSIECKTACTKSTKCQSFSFCARWNSCFMKDQVLARNATTIDSVPCNGFYKKACRGSSAGSVGEWRGRNNRTGGARNICIGGFLAPEFFLIGFGKCGTSSFSDDFVKGVGVVRPSLANEPSAPRWYEKELNIFNSRWWQIQGNRMVDNNRFNRSERFWLGHYPRCTP